MLPMLGLFAIVVVRRRAALYERFGAKADDHRRAPLASRSGRSCSRWSTPTPATASLVPGLAVTGIGAGLFYPVGHHRRGHRARPVARRASRAG